MMWRRAIAHVAIETARGFRGGLADVHRARNSTLTPREREILREGAGVEVDDDPLRAARRGRLAREEQRRAEEAAEEWLERHPGIAERLDLGSLTPWHLHRWALSPEPLLGVDVTPLGAWQQQPERVIALWEEHKRDVEQRRGWT